MEPGVGPFVDHRAVETLYLSVGLRPVGPGGPVGGSDTDECLSELGGADVVHRSVGEHPLGPDPALGEVGGRPEHEPRAGRSAFIAEDLDVGAAGAVVDRSVEVVVTRSAFAVDLSSGR